MAGEDADLPMVSYPTAIQETLDLCIDVTVRATAAMSSAQLLSHSFMSSLTSAFCLHL